MPVETLHDGYFRIRRAGAVELLSAPGHDVVIVVGVVPGPGGHPRFVVKTGDTRPSRVLSGRSLVKDGLVGGRLDAPGAGPDDIARAEVEEEVGGQVAGPVWALGDRPVPSMPVVSTEADLFRMAPVRFDPGSRPRGDGGGMEVPELLGYRLVDPPALMRMIRVGALGEVCRARVAYGRAFEKLGLLGPETRGLGPVVPVPDGGGAPSGGSAAGTTEPVDDARIEIERVVSLERGRHLVVRVTHTARGAPRGEPYVIEIHDPDFEEVEILEWARDPEGRVRVRIELIASPVLEVKATLTGERIPIASPTRLWQGRIERPSPGGELNAALLGRGAPPQCLLAGEASPGQSTLLESVWAAEVPAPEAEWPTLAEAIRLCREEGASARTEAGLLELEERVR